MAQSAGRLARRSLLRWILSTVGASAFFHAASRPAGAVIKISQKAVAYQDHPEGDKRCDRCIQFQPPDACKTVDGTISPRGYCRLFALNRQSARRSQTVGATV